MNKEEIILRYAKKHLEKTIEYLEDIEADCITEIEIFQQDTIPIGLKRCLDELITRFAVLEKLLNNEYTIALKNQKELIQSEKFDFKINFEQIGE